VGPRTVCPVPFNIEPSATTLVVPAGKEVRVDEYGLLPAWEIDQAHSAAGSNGRDKVRTFMDRGERNPKRRARKKFQTGTRSRYAFERAELSRNGGVLRFPARANPHKQDPLSHESVA